VGARLGEITTQGYTIVEPPRPKQPLIHVHADPDELGRVYQVELLIASGMAELAASAKALPAVEHAAWADWAAGARQDYLKTLEPGPSPGRLDLGRVIRMVNERMPPETFITSDAGNFAGWLNRFYQFPGFRTFAGDGGFLMTGQELATAVQYGANVVFIVVNNGLYGTIRMHQEREFPGR